MWMMNNNMMIYISLLFDIETIYSKKLWKVWNVRILCYSSRHSLRVKAFVASSTTPWCMTLCVFIFYSVQILAFGAPGSLTHVAVSGPTHADVIVCSSRSMEDWMIHKFSNHSDHEVGMSHESDQARQN